MHITTCYLEPQGIKYSSSSVFFPSTFSQNLNITQKYPSYNTWKSMVVITDLAKLPESNPFRVVLFSFTFTVFRNKNNRKFLKDLHWPCYIMLSNEKSWQFWLNRSLEIIQSNPLSSQDPLNWYIIFFISDEHQISGNLPHRLEDPVRNEA